MIKSLHIKNIQSHKNTKLELDPGVNVIIGNSDVGKSAIIRALYWLVFNKPTGEDYRSHWNGDMFVKGVFDNGIVRHIRGNKNKYKLNKNLMTGFGVNVPEPISELINMNDLNFVMQGDRPFMIDWSPGERSLYLNKITNLSIIDSTNKNIKQTIKKEKNSIKACSENISDIEKEIKNFDDLQEMDADLKTIEKLSKDIDENKNKIYTIGSIIKDIDEIDEELESLDYIEKAQKEIKKMLSLSNKLQTIKKEKNRLSKVVKEIKLVRSIIKKKIKRKEKLVKLYNKSMPDICPLCGSQTSNPPPKSPPKMKMAVN